jgi:hypothetical protein
MVFVAACGGPQGPALQNAPKVDPAPIAGVVAGAAAAMTLADPNAATRGKPEQAQQKEEPKPIDVKERVPESAFDHLEHKNDANAATPAAATKRKGPLPKLPSPKEAAEKEETAKQQ